MWTCPKCGTRVDPGFDVCWNCGTTADGMEDPSFATADAVAADASPLENGAAVDPLPAGPTGELVEAYRALDLQQAKFLADQLTAQGIAAVSDTHDMHDTLGSMNSLPRVWVGEADLARAREWLDAFDVHNGAEPDRAD